MTEDTVNLLWNYYKTAVIVSSNNKALETVCEKVRAFGESEETPNQRRVKKSLARLGNQNARKKFNKEHALSGEKAFKSKEVTYEYDSLTNSHAIVKVKKRIPGKSNVLS